MTKIIAISGSLRKASFNTALLKAMQTHAPAGCQIELGSITGIPLYNQDSEQTDGIPAAVTQLKNKIIASDGVLISTPEYNHGIPGVLKNALDWLTRPPEDLPAVFHNRKVGLVGASPGRLGTAFSQTAWLPILRYLNVHAYFAKQLFVSSAHTAFDQTGQLIDQNLAPLLIEYINGFTDFLNS